MVDHNNACCKEIKLEDIYQINTLPTKPIDPQFIEYISKSHSNMDTDFAKQIKIQKQLELAEEYLPDGYKIVKDTDEK